MESQGLILAKGELVAQVRDEIDSQIADSKPLTEEWIKQYEEDFKKYAPPRRDILKSSKAVRSAERHAERSPREPEETTRAREHRAIIVSATGTGKTYLSAFDVREYRPRRMLYIAQQQMILKAAMKSYQSARLSAIRAGTVYRHQQTTGSALRVRHGADHASAGGTGAIRL